MTAVCCIQMTFSNGRNAGEMGAGFIVSAHQVFQCGRHVALIASSGVCFRVLSHTGKPKTSRQHSIISKIVTPTGPNSALRSRNAQRGDPCTMSSFLHQSSFETIFFTAQLGYEVQVLHCAKSHTPVYISRFALFIWDSESKPMGKDNLFRNIERGGSGETNVF